MDKFALSCPKDYYIVEEGEKRILYRPDGTKVVNFDNRIARNCEIGLAAFEGHSERLSGDKIIPNVEHG